MQCFLQLKFVVQWKNEVLFFIILQEGLFIEELKDQGYDQQCPETKTKINTY